HAHFGDFLKKNFPNVMGLEKYMNGISAIELYGEELVRKVGVEAAHAMCVSAITSSDERRNKLVASIQAHIEDYGVAPCRDTIRNIVKGIAPEIQKPHKTTRSILEIERLRSENNELRKEVKLLQKKVKELEGK